MTDNRTNEQIVADALRQVSTIGWHSRSAGVIEAVNALSNAGRLVTAQGAAQQAAKDVHEPNHDRVYCVRCGGNWPCQPAPVLPSSTTPQAEAYDHCCQHPKCPGGSLCCCVSEQRLRDCWNQWREEVAGDTKQAFRDAYSAGRNDPAPWAAAPVLPSSGVKVQQ